LMVVECIYLLLRLLFAAAPHIVWCCDAWFSRLPIPSKWKCLRLGFVLSAFAVLAAAPPRNSVLLSGPGLNS
jgi:hypothetical protein